MDFVELKIGYTPYQPDVVIGLLSQFEEIHSIQELDMHLLVFLDESSFSQIKEPLLDTIVQHNWTYEERKLPARNWNEEWEANFKPIHLEDLCLIRADFHSPDPSFKYEIILNPKNAFGTGHHETTYLMMDSMCDIAWVGKRCLDLGTGTGILSIWAHHLGCREIVAIDNTTEAVENTQENFSKNQISKGHTVRLGTITLVENQKYDIILANINRAVLIESASIIINCLDEDGDLLLSGILQEDLGKVEHAYQRLRLIKKAHKGEWSLLHYKV